MLERMKQWERKILDGAWKLYWADHGAVKTNADSYTTAEGLAASGMPSIDAEVPGNFEQSLYKAGVIDDPYFGMNTLDMQKYENKHVWYAAGFDLDFEPDNETILLFEGVDNYADIYINGKLAASLDNMLIEHIVPGGCLARGCNEIVVHIRPAVIEKRDMPVPSGSMSLKYNAASLYTRKAAHMYGWDIFPRIVSAGVWRGVSVVRRPAERIDDIYAQTSGLDPGGDWATVSFYFDARIEGDYVCDYRLVLEASCGGSKISYENRMWHPSGRFSVNVGSPKLWWPRNSGCQHMYDAAVSLYRGDELLDTYCFRFGIRTVALERTSITDMKGKGEFCFMVNGRKVFVSGTNWVGLDAFPSNGLARLPEALALLDDVGCNMVRCWGGAVYEHDDFYHFCDSKGILIWQDFGMACAVYPMDKTFIELMEKEVAAVVKRLRGHPSLALWSGDNECDWAYASWSGLPRDPNENVVTRKLIPEMLALHDCARPYLPSSPYMDETAYREGIDYISEYHLWGPRDYFKSPFYTNSLAHFASEIGYHGCPEPQSMKKFISESALWPWRDNEEWLVHSASPEVPAGAYTYRIELIAKQIRELFGAIPGNLEDFALASQISQAEAFKYFIELFRVSKWRRTGILWWNLIDGWPQLSDAVVDYYYVKKLAYHYIKRSQQPVCMMFGDPSDWHLPLYISNNTPRPVTLKYTVKDVATGAVLKEGESAAAADSSVCVWRKDFSMEDKGMYLIEWEADGIAGANHYLTGSPVFGLREYVGWITKAGLYQIG